MGGEIPGSSFMELEKFQLCQAKERKERIHAKCRRLSSRTISTALVTAEQAFIVLGKCIRHKGNFFPERAAGFLFLPVPPPFLFFKGRDF